MIHTKGSIPLILFVVCAVLWSVAGLSKAQSTPTPVGQGGSWNLIFADEFNGTSLDLTKWRPNWLGPSDTAITKPVNGAEVSCYDPSQVSVGNGELRLKAVARNCQTWNFASGLIESNGKFNYTYGYIEARMWMPAGVGVWPAFWSNGPNWPAGGEIDVVEAYGTEKSSYHYHYAGCGGDCGPGGNVTLPGATSGWHTYAAHWEPGIITWYYDGVMVWKYTTGIVSTPQYLIVNLGLNSTQAAVPATLKVDYVRVWKSVDIATPKPTNTPTPDAGLVTNTAPTISDVIDRAINEDSFTGSISFTVSDTQSLASSLTLSATSSNPALLPAANIVFGGSGGSRTVTVTPIANAYGSTTITLTVSDGELTSSDSFVLTVNSVNDAPTISNITDQGINWNTTTNAIAFTIRDVETSGASLTLSSASSNTTLVPLGNIVYGGSGENRIVSLIPAANQWGTATITVTVSDGALTASDSFVLTVNQPSDALFGDGFEGGTLSAWASGVTDGSDLSVSGSAVLTGSFGLQAVINDNHALYVTDNTPSGERLYRARFYFDPNGLVMAPDDNFVLFYGYQDSITEVLQLQMRYASGRYEVRAAALDDSGTWVYGNFVALADAPHLLELAWQSASAAGASLPQASDPRAGAGLSWQVVSVGDADLSQVEYPGTIIGRNWQAANAAGVNNGSLTLWVDGVQASTVTGIDSDTRSIDWVLLGAVGIDAGTSGRFYLDDFLSRRFTYIGPNSAGMAALAVVGLDLEAMPTLEPTVRATDVPLALQVVEAENNAVARTANWLSLNTVAAASGGSYLVNGAPESSLALTFSGSQFEIGYISSPSFGRFGVEVDGITVLTVDSSTAQEATLLQARIDLNEGIHSARLLPLDGIVAVDTFAVLGSILPLSALVQPENTPMPEATRAVVVMPEAAVPATPEVTLPPSMTDEVRPEPTLAPTATPPMMPFSLPLYQTMDDGAPLWTATAGWQLSAEGAYAGLGWRASASGQLEMLMLSVPVDLGAAQSPHLSFQTRLASLSLPEVQVSTDGRSWQTLALVPTSNEWTAVSVDLIAYAGQTIYIQFVWLTPLPVEEQVIDTWQVDNLVVLEVPPTIVPTDLPTATETPLATEVVKPTDIPPETTVEASVVPVVTDEPQPTALPTDVPTATPEPTNVPTDVPTATPEPTSIPTDAPSAEPSQPTPELTIEAGR